MFFDNLIMVKKLEDKLLYSGNSLEISLRIKNSLQARGINYSEGLKKNDSWLRFFTQLFVVGTGSYGMNREHEIQYNIYVKHEDYDKAKQILENIQDDQNHTYYSSK